MGLLFFVVLFRHTLLLIQKKTLMVHQKHNSRKKKTKDNKKGLGNKINTGNQQPERDVKTLTCNSLKLFFSRKSKETNQKKNKEGMNDINK